MTEILICLKCKNKIWLGSYIVENAEIRYRKRTAWVLYC